MFTKGNLRKNFLRVKQTADQKLGRSEKTELLSDDLQSSEKKVELVKQVSTNTGKKVQASLLGTGTSDVDKRLKKMPEAGIAHSMIEAATVLGTEDVMGQMYNLCGDCQNSLAKNHLEYEIDVEKQVLEPIQNIIDNEIPQITKLKKALTKLALDMDSAKSRWHSAVRQTHVPGVNMATAASKADSVKEELEEAEARVEGAKDAYTTGLFSFISRGTEHSQNLLTLLEAQANYHAQALDIINKVIPKMKETLNCSPIKPVYGLPLEEHLRVTNRDIAQVLEACICYLLEAGLEEEGLFRIAGMASKVKRLKASFDAGIDFDETGELDPHTVAGALKQYLRELQEPLLTFQLFPEFMAAAQMPTDQRLQQLWIVVDKLPKPNYDNFRYLIKFLSKLSEKSEVNKMTPGNIAIVIGPNLIWSEGDNGPNMMNTGILSLITELIVQHADWFFPGEENFYIGQGNSSPLVRAEPEEHRAVERSNSDQSNSSVKMTQQSSPATKPEPKYESKPEPKQEATNLYPNLQAQPVSPYPAQPASPHLAQQSAGSISPSVSPAASNTNLTNAPIAESEDLAVVVRRQPRKPAPPPPERPFSVAGSMNIRPGQSPQYQTWPRQAAPLVEDDDSVDTALTNEQIKLERPAPPERVSSLPYHVDRPKIPPPVVPPTHKRSASTGAPVVIPGGQLNTVNSESATGSASYLQASESVEHNHINQLTTASADKPSPSSLTKPSVSRPLRPMPPPPPPPETSIVEQTHL